MTGLSHAGGKHSLIFVLLLLGALLWLKLGALLISVLFSFFVLEKLLFFKRKWLIVTAFAGLVGVVISGSAIGVGRAIKTLPDVAETTIPLIIHYAQAHGVEVPFSDWNSLKEFAMQSLKEDFLHVGNFANLAAKQLVFVLLGIVAAVGLYLNPGFRHDDSPPSLYTEATGTIAGYFRSFYESFRTVMGAQLIISSINTVLTASFILPVGLPYASTIIILTFLCGLLPIVGNLISNTITVGIAFTVSPRLALGALLFLIVVHKLEYFLNSKIVGDRIKNPVWLTLLGLVIGERMLGITGMILAAVVLHFLKTQTSRVKIAPAPTEVRSETTMPVNRP